MTVAELGTALNSITIGQKTLKFAHHAWSKAPEGDYGVYAEDSAIELSVDGLNGEQAIEGTIDYFTRDDSDAIRAAIQAKLNELRIVWHLNLIAYESDSGFIHYEWVFRLYG